MSLARISKAVGAALTLLVVLVYVGYLAVYVVYAVELFRWPFDYDQGEGFELYDAILYSQGQWPYRDNAVYPFYASNYPPLFHLLIVPLLPLFGPRLIAGRLVSFAATLVTGGAISLVVRRKVGGWFIPLISGLAFLASNYVYQLGPLCRMHMTMVMFETLAVVFIAQFEHPRRGKRNLLLGLLMLLCAGYTKQMAVFTVAAVFSYIFLRDVKKSIVSGVGLTLAAGAIFWLLNAATDGQWWINTIQANVNQFDYRQTLFLFGQWFRLHAVLILLAAGYLLYELFWARLSVYSLWFFFALGSGALSGKWGAGFGYFTTAVAAACISSGLVLGHLRKAASRKRTLGQRAQSLTDTAVAGAGLASKLGLSRLRALLGRRSIVAEPRFSSKQAGRLLLGALRRLSSQAPGFLTILVPLLYLLQAPRTLHLPTSGPVFGPLARTLGVADELVRSECSTPEQERYHQYHDTMGYTQLGHLLTADDYAAGEKILEYVRASDGPVFSEEAMFSLLVGEPVVTNPTQLLNLYNNGLLDTTEIVERVNRQEFGLVIFRAQFYPPPVRDAIGQNYEPVDHLCMNGFYYHILWPQRRLESGGQD